MAVFKSPHKPQYESPNSRIHTIRKELVEILSLWFPLHHQTTVHSWNWSFFNYNMVFGYRLHLELQLCLCVHVLCNHHEPTDLNRTFIFMGAWVLYVNSINLYGQMKLHNKSRFWDYELLVFPYPMRVFSRNTARRKSENSNDHLRQLATYIITCRPR